MREYALAECLRLFAFPQRHVDNDMHFAVLQRDFLEAFLWDASQVY